MQNLKDFGFARQSNAAKLFQNPYPELCLLLVRLRHSLPAVLPEENFVQLKRLSEYNRLLRRPVVNEIMIVNVASGYAVATTSAGDFCAL